MVARSGQKHKKTAWPRKFGKHCLKTNNTTRDYYLLDNTENQYAGPGVDH